jgi:LmbE family N-acetylglucosaminyl deacetylase
MSTKRLMAILAHPDDETLGFGGSLAKYAAEGVETFLVTATRGEYGWFGAPEENPGPIELGRIREGELRRAAAILGVRQVTVLDYIDGHLDQAPPNEIIGELAHLIRWIRPDVVVTFGQDGIYGHPDHIAISQFATAAVMRAGFHGGGFTEAGHTVSKLYYRAASQQWLNAYEHAFGELVMHIDGVERRAPAWSEWVMTTRLDAGEYSERVWAAVQEHRSQLPGYEKLLALPPSAHREYWGTQDYYRVMSQVNGGRAIERDLFEGIGRALVRDASATAPRREVA